MNRIFLLLIMMISYIISGCRKSCSMEPAVQNSTVKDSVVKQSVTKNSGNNDSITDYSNRILVDASKDGGTWWFPQGANMVFSAKMDHQGSDLVSFLVSLGYAVDELPRDTVITSMMLTRYSKIIRATGFTSYTDEELQAYDDFLNKGGSLLLLADFLRGENTDGLAEHLGLKLRGTVRDGANDDMRGLVTVFTPDPITAGVMPLDYIAGSAVINASNNPNITILGSLDSTYYLDLNSNSFMDSSDLHAPPVMGKLNNLKGKVFFLGDINGLEGVPQPLTKNIFHWLFN